MGVIGRLLCLLSVLAVDVCAQSRADAVLILPFQGDSAEQISLGVGVHNLLENMLLQHGGLDENWAQSSYLQLFPRVEDLRGFREGKFAEPAVLQSFSQRWVVRGRMTAGGVILAAEDRVSGKTSNAEIPFDPPAWIDFRRAFVELLHEAGVPFDAARTEHLYWKEALPLHAMAGMGRGLQAYVEVMIYEAPQKKHEAYTAAPFLDVLTGSESSYLLNNNLAYLYSQKDYAVFEDAHRYFDIAAQLNPFGIDTLDGRLMLAAESPEKEEILSGILARKAAARQKSSPGPEVWLEAARFLEATGDRDGGEPQSARPRYELAARILREHVDAAGAAPVLSKIALTYLQDGEIARAAEAAEQALPLLDDGPAKADALGTAGLSYAILGDRQKAAVYYEKELPLRSALGHQADEALLHDRLGRVAALAGGDALAAQHFAAAQSLAERLGNQYLRGVTANNAGLSEAGRRRFPEAIQSFQKSLEARRAAADSLGEAITLRNLARAERESGLNNAARDHEAQASRIKVRELPFHEWIRFDERYDGEAFRLEALAGMQTERQNWAEANRLLGQARTSRQEWNDAAGEVDVLLAMAQNAAAANQPAWLDFARQALEIAENAKDDARSAAAADLAGEALAAQLKPAEAGPLFRTASLAARRSGDWLKAGLTQDKYSVMLYRTHAGEPALEGFHEALALYRRANNLRGEGSALRNIAVVLDSLERPEEQIRYAEYALAFLHETHDAEGEARLQEMLGRLYAAGANIAKGRAYVEEAVKLREQLHQAEAIGQDRSWLEARPANTLAQRGAAPEEPKFRLKLQALDNSLGEQLIAFADNGITAISWLANGSDAIVWDLRTSRQVKRLNTEGCGNGYLGDVTVSSDGSHMTGTLGFPFSSAARCTWNLLTSALEKKEDVPGRQNQTVTVKAASGNTAALRQVGSDNRHVELTVSDGVSGEVLLRTEVRGCVFAAEVAACGSLGGAAATTVIWFGKRGSVDRWSIPQRANVAWFSPDASLLFLAEEQVGAAATPRRAEQDRWNAGILSANIESGVVSVYDVGGRKRIDQLPPQTHNVGFSASPDGGLIAIFGGGECRLWSTAERKIVHILKSHRTDDNGLPSSLAMSFSSAAFSPDGTTLTAGDWSDGSFHRWDVKSGKELGGLRSFVKPVGSGLVLSPDGKYLAIDQGFVSIWSLDTWREILRVPAEREAAIAFSPAKPLLAVGSPSTGSVLLWNLELSKLAGGFTVPSPVRQLAFRADGKFLYVLNKEGKVSLCDVRNDDLTPTLRREYRSNVDQEMQNAIQAAGMFGNGQPDYYALSFSPTGFRAATRTKTLVNVADSRDAKQILEIPVHGRYPIRLPDEPVISKDGVWLLVYNREDATSGPSIELWNLETKSFVQRFRMPGSDGDATFSDSGEVVTMSPGKIIFWDRDLGIPKQQISIPTGFQTVIDWRRKLVYSAGEPGVEIFRLASGEKIATITSIAGGHEIFLDQLAAGGDTRELEQRAESRMESFVTPILGASWVVTSADGRFDTNQLDDISGMQWVADDDPLRALPIEIFLREYFTPGLLFRLMKGESPDTLPDLAQRNRVQPAVEITSVIPSKGKPGTVDVTVTVKNMREGSRDSGARDLKLFRDGRLVATRALQAGVVEHTILIPGINLPSSTTAGPVEFTAYAFNSDLVKSATHRYLFSPSAPAVPRRGRAFVLTIGVNATPNLPGLALRFAVNDAQSMAAELRQRLQRTGDWADVVTKTLISTSANPRGASKEAIRAALASLASDVRPEDLLVVAISSHGFTGPDGRFYLVPSDIRGEAGNPRMATAISTDELSEMMRPIDAGHIVLLVDACQSAATVNSQGFKPGPMGSSGLGQLAYDKRMWVLAASQSDGVALETGALQHGLLTYALLAEGIERGEADWQPSDGQVTLGEWLAFGAHRVPALAQDLRTGKIRGTGARGLSAEDVPDRLTQTPTLFDFRRYPDVDPVLIKKPQ